MSDKPLDELSKISARLVDYVITAVTGVPLPIATLSVGSIGVYAAWKASNFAANLAAFMREPSKLDPKIRREFEERLGDDKTKFMNEVFQTIDQIENEDKSEILGKVFSVHMMDKVSREDYHQLSSMIRNTTYADLKDFLYDGKDEIQWDRRQPILQRLEFARLMSEEQILDFEGAERSSELTGGKHHPQMEYKYRYSDYGKMLHNVIHLTVDELRHLSSDELRYHPVSKGKF